MDSVIQPSLRQWRREQRVELLDRRMAIAPRQRKRFDTAIEATLYALLRESGARRVSLYWPFKGEFNTRGLMQKLVADGVGVALPDVVATGAPLVFRPWHPQAPMRRGVYAIPVPQTEAVVAPDVVVAPLVGFDSGGYRLGHGGGYYDRTLAVLEPAPLVVGVGYELSRIQTIRPRAHDVPMDRVVTEAGLYVRPAAGGLVPAPAGIAEPTTAPDSTHSHPATQESS
ncbi:5-formyltetrahydrofolate cyclo-ligase [Salinisphaera aquimarina]|uniref:5-formyltetrahydrofolate cyclo-ligase n=1 Tax=Salinisphaera aquimarina TaxID=2094031 RepID=A0ABV7EUF7_9GAMM